MALWRLYYHIVWSTKEREPIISTEFEADMYGHIRWKANDIGCIIHAENGIEDHIHLIASIPPKLAVAEFVRQIKGSSSHYINHQHKPSQKFTWQRGYGVFSISQRSVDEAIAYVLKQKDHHQSGKLIRALEADLVEDDGPALVILT